MSAKGPATSVRPAILVQPGYESSDNGRLRDAIAIADEKERRECIGECIKRMTGQYDHKDWRFVFETLEAFRHLPATTLDLWDCFARNPHAMAMLLIETDESNYQRVIELANELPFVWELVPFNAWLEALCTLREFIRSSAPEGMADMLVEHGVNEKLKYVAESDALLEKMVLVLSEKVIGKEVEDLKDAMVLAVPGVIDQLITSASNDLRQRQGADVHWAEFHGRLFEEIRIQSPKLAQSLYTNQAAYMESVLHAPVAMAIRTCTMQTEQLVKLSNTDLYQLQQIRQFDEQWYREAFSLTVVYLFSADLLNNETNKENNE